MTIKGRSVDYTIMDEYGMRLKMHSYVDIVKNGNDQFYLKKDGGRINQWYYWSPYDSTRSGLHFGATIEWRLLP